MNLFGITGRYGAGKSTLANAFDQVLEQRGQKTLIMPFARALKYKFAKVASFALGSENAVWYEDVEMEKKTLHGPGLQWLGELFRQKVDPDYWVQQWVQEAASAIADGYVIIVDDVRYQNEAAAIQRLGGVIILVNRLDSGPRDDIRSDSHPSEQGYKQIRPDFALCNTTIEDLEAQARMITSMYFDDAFNEGA